MLLSPVALRSAEAPEWQLTAVEQAFVLEGDIPDTLGIVRSLEGNGLQNVKVEPQAKKNFYNIEVKVPSDLAGGAST